MTQRRITLRALGLEFGSDYKLVYKTPQGEFRGTYSMGSGDWVTFDLDRPLANGKVHQERITVAGERHPPAMMKTLDA